MKIEFEVPTWAIGKHLYMFAGVELLGVKEVVITHQDGKHIATYPNPLKLKPNDGQCNKCGICCQTQGVTTDILLDIKERIAKFDFTNIESNTCVFYEKAGGCILRGWTPFSCVKSICTPYEGCSERLDEVI